MYAEDLWIKEKTCRLCLIGDAKVCIFKEKAVLNNIMTYCKLEVLKNDGLPSLICSECIHKIEDITKFITQCQENEKILRGNLELRNVHDNDIVLSHNEIETVATDNIIDFDDKDDLEIPDELHLNDDDEKNLMDTIQVSENGEEFLYCAGIKIIVNRKKSQETEMIPKKTVNRSKRQFTLCPICGKTITKSVTYHMRLHGEKKYSCDICSKAFGFKEKLKDHIKTHSEVRDFPCTECSKKFKAKNALNKHMLLVHRGPIVWHSCGICNKRFKTKHALKKHSPVHTCEPKYECAICNKKFSYKCSLGIHMRTHTGEKPYPCKYCDKRFAASTYRLEHERFHTGEKPYKCTECDKRFLQLSNMKSHFRNNHKGVEFKRKHLIRSVR